MTYAQNGLVLERLGSGRGRVRDFTKYLAHEHAWRGHLVILGWFFDPGRLSDSDAPTRHTTIRDTTQRGQKWTMDTDWALAATAFACVTATEISWLPSMDLFSPNLRTLLLRRQDHRQPSTTKSSTWTSYSGGSCSLVLTVKTGSKPRAPFPLLHARVVTHPSSPTLPQPAPCRFSSSLRALSGTCWFPFCPLWRLDYGHNFADAARLPRSPAAAAMPPRIWMPNVRMRLKLRPAPSESGRVAMPVCFERFIHRSPAEMWGRVSAIEVGTRPVCNARASHYGYGQTADAMCL